MDNEELHEDIVLGGLNSLEDRRKRGGAVDQQFHVIVLGEGKCGEFFDNLQIVDRVLKPRCELLAILRQFFGDMLQAQLTFATSTDVAFEFFATEHPIQRHSREGK